jgi:mono/diheme cytochrome c family protein
MPSIHCSSPTFRRFFVAAALLAAALLVFACKSGGDSGEGGEGGEGGAGGASGDAMAEAREIFQQRCVTCHGETGAGNGPASSGLDPQPRNFTSAEWQAEVTDEHIERIIVSGGAAVGRSPAMPNNPDLNGKPEVVRGLRQIIRSFGSE